jgi:two-component system, chemotaxis family, sensor kinase CheA
MEELRQSFIADSTDALRNLQTKLQQDRDFSADAKREVFRALHTIKGTAQTFGFTAAAGLAHTLENLLAAAEEKDAARGELTPASEAATLLIEGIEALNAALADENFQVPSALGEKLRPFQTEMPAKDSFHRRLPPEFPDALAAQMSEQEKSALRRAFEDGRDLAILEIGFEPQTFADEFKIFRDRLNQNGEWLAAFPSAKFAAQNKIGFQIVLAAAANKSFESLIENTSAKIVWQLRPGSSENEPEFLRQIVGHGKFLAENLGKKIEFETSCQFRAAQFSARQIKIIFNALLHLVRNAVDHGVEREGKIKIEIADAGAGRIRARVADNGRGIDAEKIKRAAVEKNLITAEGDLSEQEILNLIFAHGFSTSAAVTEISGRGVGLDAVKAAVEKAGGEIRVESKLGEGTTFEIWLAEK